MQKSTRRNMILMDTAGKIARNNCTAAEITKLVREHYEPPPATPYKYEKICQKTSQTLLHETPENAWKDGFNRRIQNMMCGFYSLPNEPYKNMGGKFELDPFGLVMGTMSESLNTKVWAHRKARVIPTLSKQKVKKRRRSLLPSVPIKPTESEFLAQQQLKSDGGIDSIKNQLLQLNTAKKHVQWGQSFGVFIKDTMPKETKAGKGCTRRMPVSTAIKPYVHVKKSKRMSQNSLRRNQKDHKNVSYMRSVPALVPAVNMNSSINEEQKERTESVYREYLEALYVVINTLYNMSTKYLKSKTPLPLDQMKLLRKYTTDRTQLLIPGFKPETTIASTVNEPKTLGFIRGVASIFSRRKTMFSGRTAQTKKNGSVERNKMDDLYLESWEDLMAVDSFQPQPKRKQLANLFGRPNIGATHSSRISESNTPDRPPNKMAHFTRNMQNRRGHSVKKSPIWAKLAVETNEDQESDEKEQDDQNSIVSDMTTKFDDLKYKQQQETEIEIQKLERDRLLAYKGCMAFFNHMNSRFEGHLAMLSNARDNIKKTLDLGEVNVSEWYEELKYKSRMYCGCVAIEEILYKIGRHATLDHNSFNLGKAKLCLIVMSLPAYEICTVAYQTAIQFVLEDILMLDLKNLRQWLEQRKIPYNVYLT